MAAVAAVTAAALDATEGSMEAHGLHSSLDLVVGCGEGLSPEQRAALRSSLLLLQRDYRYHRVLFWGRIRCLNGDYHIARGVEEPAPGEEPEELRGLKTLYRSCVRELNAGLWRSAGDDCARILGLYVHGCSRDFHSPRYGQLPLPNNLNCVDWSLLPPPTQEIIAQCSVVKGCFTGDPSHEYEHTEIKKSGEGDATYAEEITTTIKEESRLVATIAQIEHEVAVVPRGAFIKTPLGNIRMNRSFPGLTVSEAKQLSSYFHFTVTPHPKNRTLLEKADLDLAIDFLDSLEHDIPKGSLSSSGGRIRSRPHCMSQKGTGES